MKIGPVSKFRVLAGGCGLLLTLALILVISVPALAQPPMPIVHQFWGSVTIESAPAPEGIAVEAKIGAVVYGNGTVDADGNYGYVPNFFVEAPDNLVGQTITFYVAGQEAGTATFEFLGATNLNLAVGEAVQYWVHVSSTEGGNVTEPTEGNHTYYAGQVVDLLAVEDVSFYFGNWTGDMGTVADVNAADTTITMNGNYAIVANFFEGVGPTTPPP